MINMIKTILLIALCFLFIVFFNSTTYATTSLTKTEIPEPYRITDEEVASGEIKAVVVRIGFSDAPANDTNPVYKTLNDDYLKAVFDGKEDGFNMPYNGLSDYLYKSSYGKLSMKLGCIIDIQLNKNHNTDNFYIVSYDDLQNEINKNIDISNYDANGDGCIDALYLFDLKGENLILNGDECVLGTVGRDLKEDFEVQSHVYMCFTDEQYKDAEQMVNTLIHETGHLLLDLQDYYKLENYPYTFFDIGNIMGFGAGDYDAFSKWKANWLTDENIVAIAIEKGDTGEITLTPYDSDTAAGFKLALMKYGDGYIAVDYCGGLNNDDYNTGLRNKGFRFYKIRDTLGTGFVQIEEVYYKGEFVQERYQLFSDGEVIDINPNNSMIIKIYDIVTGDSPSFKYMVTDNKEVAENADKPTEPIEQTDSTDETASSDNTNNKPDARTKTTENKKTDDNPSKNQDLSSGKVSSNTHPVTKVVPVQPATTSPPQTGDKNTWPPLAGASAALLGVAVVVKRKKKI